MKKQRITYGVSGMMEYQAVVKVGKNNVSILFSDGSVSAMGTNPATYSTDNIILQHAIENSPDYKRGRIKTISTIELDEELVVERPIATAEKAKETVKIEETDLSDKSDESDMTESDESAEVETSEPSAETTSKTEVEFTCNDDAKDYLEQTFGFVRSKLRNRDDIIAAGASKNVQITFV